MNNYFYVEYQSQGIALVKATEQEIIDVFLEETTTPKGNGKKYFYNQDDKLIYCYYAGGQCLPTSKYEYSLEEAQSTLLEMALENSNNQLGNTIMFSPTNDPKWLIDDIEDYLDNIDEDNQELSGVLEKIIEELRAV